VFEILFESILYDSEQDLHLLPKTLKGATKIISFYIHSLIHPHIITFMHTCLHAYTYAYIKYIHEYTHTDTGALVILIDSLQRECGIVVATTFAISRHYFKGDNNLLQ